MTTANNIQVGGGVDDLRKARHYLDKLIELEDNAA